MIISKIERQKRNEKRFSVYIDGEFKFGIDGVDLLYFKLAEGMEISEQRYEHILTNVVFAKAKSDALNYLGYRAHTEKELADKLKNDEYTDDTIEKVIDLLKRYGYINDVDYAEKFIKDKRRLNKWGSRKIKYELIQKGVDSHTVDEALNVGADIDLVNAKRLAEKKFGVLDELDYKEKQKAFNFLMRKGFTYATINKMLSGFDEIDEGSDDYI